MARLQWAPGPSCWQGETYNGKTSPWWYDADSFYELTQAAGRRAVRELVEVFAGCSGQGGQGGCGILRSVSNHSPETKPIACFSTMRQRAASRPKRLGAVGPSRIRGQCYARVPARSRPMPPAAALGHIPYVVEAWAEHADRPSILFHVNRTPITAELQIDAGA